MSEIQGKRISELSDKSRLAGTEMIPFADGSSNGRFFLSTLRQWIQTLLSPEIAAASKALLVKVWENACSARVNYSVPWNFEAGYGYETAHVGRYNEETGLFELNGLTDISELQAIRILLCWLKGDCESGRTNLPIRGGNGYDIAQYDMLQNSDCEVWWGSPRAGTAPKWVVNNTALREMRYVNLDSYCMSSVISRVPALVTLECVKVEMTAINISGSPSLSVESVAGLCAKAPQGAVITLHPDAFAAAVSTGLVAEAASQRNIKVTSA